MAYPSQKRLSDTTETSEEDEEIKNMNLAAAASVQVPGPAAPAVRPRLHRDMDEAQVMDILLSIPEISGRYTERDPAYARELNGGDDEKPPIVSGYRPRQYRQGPERGQNFGQHHHQRQHFGQGQQGQRYHQRHEQPYGHGQSRHQEHSQGHSQGVQDQSRVNLKRKFEQTREGQRLDDRPGNYSRDPGQQQNPSNNYRVTP